MLWEAVEEDPVIGRGSGVKKVVVGGWGQGMGARGVVHGVMMMMFIGTETLVTQLVREISRMQAC